MSEDDYKDILAILREKNQDPPDEDNPSALSCFAADILERFQEYGFVHPDDMDDLVNYEPGESWISIDLLILSVLLERARGLH